LTGVRPAIAVGKSGLAPECARAKSVEIGVTSQRLTDLRLTSTEAIKSETTRPSMPLGADDARWPRPRHADRRAARANASTMTGVASADNKTAENDWTDGSAAPLGV
jgi:hypothetical protein